MTVTAQRLPAIDALKGLACLMIVLHHLAFYGPMSDVVYPQARPLIDWFYDYARMAVQVFLVVAGFLAAASLAPAGTACFTRPFYLVYRRYLRLVLPYLVAIAASVVVAAAVRPYLDHASVPDSPTLMQIAAHVFMLQDLLGQESLSAGLWYVAIDLQLFGVAVMLLGIGRLLATRWPRLTRQVGAWLVVVLGLLSLFVFNLMPALDTTALYFFGSYMLGMAAWWTSNNDNPALRVRWLVSAGVVCIAALVLEFRGRIALAAAVALLLVWLQTSPAAARAYRMLRLRWLEQVGVISYSIFLIHFPVCLLVNAVISYFWPAHLMANLLGLLSAFVLSCLAGAALYVSVESRAATRPVQPIASRSR